MNSNPATILLIDDQDDLVASICMALEAEDYQVLSAGDGLAGLNILKDNRVDLILADIAMPGLNGYQLYEEIRRHRKWHTIPFIFLTARALDSDIRYGKELGADDYLTKPIEIEDLLAVVKGKLLRHQQLNHAQPRPMSRDPESKPEAICLGNLTVDRAQHIVTYQGETVILSAKEFLLLEYMAHHANELVTAQDLIKATHGLETDHIEAGTLARPLIRSVRRKLGFDVGEMGCIDNVRGVGYRLITQ